MPYTIVKAAFIFVKGWDTFSSMSGSCLCHTLNPICNGEVVQKGADICAYKGLSCVSGHRLSLCT
eukprot:2804906-Rhodomonas_salina.4